MADIPSARLLQAEVPHRLSLMHIWLFPIPDLWDFGSVGDHLQVSVSTAYVYLSLRLRAGVIMHSLSLVTKYIDALIFSERKQDMPLVPASH
jgi:hypothetical protein